MPPLSGDRAALPALAPPRAVCLLRSRRRTFWLLILVVKGRELKGKHFQDQICLFPLFSLNGEGVYFLTFFSNNGSFLFS